MLGDRALRLRQPHPLVFLLALDVDPAQLRGEKRCGAGLLDRMGWFLRARALVRVRRPAHTRQGNDAHRPPLRHRDRKSTRLNSSHLGISYAVFCLKKKKTCTELRHTAY